MKNPMQKIKGLSSEAKRGIAVGLASVVFLAAVTTAGILIKRGGDQIAEHPDSIIVYPPSSKNEPSSTEEPVTKLEDTVLEKPFIDEEVEIIRYFFDKSLPADDPTLENAMYVENNRYHSSVGLDYAKADGTVFPVLSSAAGTVKSVVPNDKTYGNIVAVEHEDTGISTIYASLGSIDVKVGQKISAGERIGTAGPSAINAGKEHSLHFEVLKDDVHQNPLKLFGVKLGQI